MRAPTIRASYAFPGELVVDNFAGGGGASTGIEAALGRPVDIAINHSPEAIAMHKANHPETRHFLENIWEVDPREACGSRPVGLAWFSPDCTHFSRAKGAKPVKKEIRALAWVVVRWAATVRPRVIILENVEEFQTWGPLLEDGHPDPSRVGETFRAWLAKLVDLGYEVEFRSLIAADYGTPTTRKRLFLVARRDGGNAVWPEPTHGEGRPESWRPASEVIDWSLPCPSIFERKRPLAEATLRRIAAGIRRFVIEAAEPFIVKYHNDRGFRGQGCDEPLRTVDTSNRFALISPTLIQTSWGEREGQAPRVPGLGKPLGTVVAGGVKHALVAAFLNKHYGGMVGHGPERPLGTVTARDHHALTTAFITKFYGTCQHGSSLREPLPTVTAGAWGGHMAEVRAFLVKYYGAAHGQEQDLFGPLHTVTSKARFGLVTVHGEEYVITDIGMRMLQPHELFRAQGFPDDYQISPEHNGKPLTKTAQIALCGNAVCPQVAEAIVAANARAAA
jgi:DNA (cytosine-5)-methyltransferase 1